MRTVSEIKRALRLDIEKLRDPRGFLNAGIPRFNRFFGRDSLISGWQLLDFDPLICRATLEALSKLQGRRFNKKTEEEPGKIIHAIHSKFSHLPYYGSIDSTPLFIIIFAFYLEKTNNLDFLGKHLSNIESAARWLKQKIEADKLGFLRYQSRQEKGQLFHQGWKDGFSDHLKIKPPVAIVEAQGYAYLALKKAAELLNQQKFDRLAEKFKKRFNKLFWMNDKNYFALALDGQNNQRQAITSNPGHLLFCEILEKGKQEAIVKKLFNPELWTKYGIRTHGVSEPDFNAKSYHLGSVWPHDNWIISQGLKKSGHKQGYLKIKRALLEAYQKIGFIPEFYGVADNKIILEMEKAVCHPQAWASGALLNFLSQK